MILKEAKVEAASGSAPEAAGGSAPQPHAHDVLGGHFLVKPKPQPFQDLLRDAAKRGRGHGRGPCIDPMLIEDCIRAAKLAKQEDCIVVVDAAFLGPNTGSFAFSARSP